MKRVLIFALTIILAIVLSYAETRKFYCINGGKCITVWKTLANTCYIMPGKYYGIFPPFASSYAKTVNTNSFAIIWPLKDDSILLNALDNDITIKNFPNSVQIVNYNERKSFYDSIYVVKDGYYSKFKDDVNYVNVDIKENYATPHESR